METKKEFEKLLSEGMCVEDIRVPDVAFMYDARARVLAKRKNSTARPGLLEMLLHFFGKELRLYHLGVSALLVSAGIFYLNEPNYAGGGDAELIGFRQEMSIHNTTISVNSSTMLTSIPTLVIRN